MCILFLLIVSFLFVMVVVLLLPNNLPTLGSINSIWSSFLLFIIHYLSPTFFPIIISASWFSGSGFCHETDLVLVLAALPSPPAEQPEGPAVTVPTVWLLSEICQHLTVFYLLITQLCNLQRTTGCILHL